MGRKPDLKVRELILQQAEHLIHLQGYHSTCMDDIAKNSGMTKANLFHHYGSKEELGLAVLDLKMACYRKSHVEPLCAQGDVAEAVFKMFADAAKFYDGNGCKAGCFVGNIALEMSDINEAFRLKVSEFFSQWAKGIAGCLSRCQDAGHFDANLDPRSSAEAILALYEGAIMLARTRRDAAVFKRVGKIARSLLDQHKIVHRRTTTMGPKTPCGC
ncbi:MAG: TetR family transcriptional regulator C-terminal domain-containing protein [Elusimicrobiota bacterium]